MKKIIFILVVLVSLAGTSHALPHHYLKAKPVYVYICVSRTAHKYHSHADCYGLARCTHPLRKVTKAQAIRMGYKPCKICYN